MAFHARSTSLPSGSHLLTVSVEDQLSRLRSGEATSSSSPSTICQNLCGLKNLYECVNDLLQLPLIHRALSHDYDNKHGGDVLDGSLRLLDLCGNTRDVFSLMKACVQDLESSIRRRNNRESNEIEKFIISRKKVNKMVLKCTSNLKRMQKSNMASLDSNCKLPATVVLLREVEEVSLTMFESLLSFICLQKEKSMSIGKYSVTKLIQSSRVSPKGEDKDLNKVEKIDLALAALNKHQSSQGNELQNVQKDLQALESTIQELEDGLECISRCLIKNRESVSSQCDQPLVCLKYLFL